jgi:hypothetical protein
MPLSEADIARSSPDRFGKQQVFIPAESYTQATFPSQKFDF